MAVQQNGRLMVVFCSVADTVGEFPWRVDTPEPGQAGGSCEGFSPGLEGRDEFANSIRCYSIPGSGEGWRWHLTALPVLVKRVLAYLGLSDEVYNLLVIN